MTTQEFSDKFDVLLNSFTTVKGSFSIQIDEYEKSVFLTKAQQDVVKSFYVGGNVKSFEETEEMRRTLDALIVTGTPEEVTGYTGLTSSSQFFQLPDDVWYITYEAASLSEPIYCSGEYLRVIPVRQDEFHRIYNNPFKQPNGRKVLRLDNGSKVVELVSAGTISSYLIRYLKKPDPIILVDIEDPVLSIDGITEVTECKLNSCVHNLILDRAVQYALQRVAGTQS